MLDAVHDGGKEGARRATTSGHERLKEKKNSVKVYKANVTRLVGGEWGRVSSGKQRILWQLPVCWPILWCWSPVCVRVCVCV